MPKLTDELARRLLAYNAAACQRTLPRAKLDWRLPTFVTDGWLHDGYAILPANAVARRYGTTRRTVCKAVKRLIAVGVIHEVGRTADGRQKLAPCLDIADECSRAEEVRNDQG